MLHSNYIFHVFARDCGSLSYLFSFTLVAFVEFEELRHPCMTNTVDDFIPNDVRLGGEEAKISLLTGANAAGKSTVLRMVSCDMEEMKRLAIFVINSKLIDAMEQLHDSPGQEEVVLSRKFNDEEYAHAHPPHLNASPA